MAMRPSAAQLQRVAELLAKRLVAADVLTLDVPVETVQARFAALLARNFEEEAEIEREAAAEAERVVRRGAPGGRREELDLRRVEQLVKQRIAGRRGGGLGRPPRRRPPSPSPRPPKRGPPRGARARRTGGPFSP